MNINWYPGHMLKTKKQIIEDLKLIDVVIEILDARIPLSSVNPDIQKIVQNKKRIVLLNKCDLADDNETAKWIKYFSNKNIVAIKTNSALGNGINQILDAIEKIMEKEIEIAKAKGIANKRIRAIILGIPNVGKSSLINRLANKKSAEVGNRPGVTKQKQWIRLNNNIELLDTPGVLWPKFEDEKVALNLAYTGTIKDEVIDKVEVAFNLLQILYSKHRNNLFERYKLTQEEVDSVFIDDENFFTMNLLELIAKKRGAIVSGGNIDEEKISGIILNDFRTGKLGRITLEKVNEE
ncbi:MAG: ribosome biogenesis GTPase YlqF [Clostridiales bacterium]|nr:ribosome biogenesis GTPase YlqF [Clostridiales bacterium]